MPGRRGTRFRVDGLGQRSGKAFLRGGLHQVDIADEDLLGERLLSRFQDERRLAVAAGGIEEDVLAVPHVGEQLGDLVLAVGEPVVQREVSESEGVRSFLMHVSIIN